MQSCFFTYLQPGPPEASCFKQIPDDILAFPKSLWLDREVTLFKNGDQWEASFDAPECCGFEPQDCMFPRGKSITSQWKGAELCAVSPILCLVAPFNFAFMQLPGLICSLIGIPMKAYQLATDEKAALYSKLAQSYLAHEKLLEEKALIEKKILQNEESMRSEKQALSKLLDSESKILELQGELKGTQEANLLTPLISQVKKRDACFYGLMNQTLPLQYELREVNLKIEACESQIEEIGKSF